MKMKKDKLIKIFIGICLIIYIISNPSFKKSVEDGFENINANVKQVNLNSEVKNTKVSDDKFKIYFTDVGQADSILIKCNDKYALVDAGNEADGQKLVTYYKNLGVNELEYVFASHPHEDHIGGMDDIINNFKINKFFMTNTYATTKTFENMLDALELKNMKFTVPKIDSTYYLDEAKIIIEYLSNGEKDLNDSSIVVKVIYGNTSFLLTGDASSKVEKQIVDKNIESTVLKLGHHGSSYSTSNEFLEKVNPKYAIISAGKNNIYNHPSKSTLEKLEKNKIETYRTDELGTIIIASDKTNIQIDNEKTDTNGD